MVDQEKTEKVDKSKTEKLRTDFLTLQQIHCDACNESTPHKVLASHETETEYTRFDESDHKTYLLDVVFNWEQIVRCERCEKVSFRSLEAVRGMHEENAAGVWVDPVYETRYSHVKESRRLLDVEESTLVYE